MNTTWLIQKMHDHFINITIERKQYLKANTHSNMQSKYKWKTTIAKWLLLLRMSFLTWFIVELSFFIVGSSDSLSSQHLLLTQTRFDRLGPWSFESCFESDTGVRKPSTGYGQRMEWVFYVNVCICMFEKCRRDNFLWSYYVCYDNETLMYMYAHLSTLSLNIRINYFMEEMFQEKGIQPQVGSRL